MDTTRFLYQVDAKLFSEHRLVRMAATDAPASAPTPEQPEVTDAIPEDVSDPNALAQNKTQEELDRIHEEVDRMSLSRSKELITRLEARRETEETWNELRNEIASLDDGPREEKIRILVAMLDRNWAMLRPERRTALLKDINAQLKDRGTNFVIAIREDKPVLEQSSDTERQAQSLINDLVEKISSAVASNAAAVEQLVGELRTTYLPNLEIELKHLGADVARGLVAGLNLHGLIASGYAVRVEEDASGSVSALSLQKLTEEGVHAYQNAVRWMRSGAQSAAAQIQETQNQIQQLPERAQGFMSRMLGRANEARLDLQKRLAILTEAAAIEQELSNVNGDEELSPELQSRIAKLGEQMKGMKKDFCDQQLDSINHQLSYMGRKIVAKYDSADLLSSIEMQDLNWIENMVIEEGEEGQSPSTEVAEGAEADEQAATEPEVEEPQAPEVPSSENGQGEESEEQGAVPVAPETVPQPTPEQPVAPEVVIAGLDVEAISFIDQLVDSLADDSESNLSLREEWMRQLRIKYGNASETGKGNLLNEINRRIAVKGYKVEVDQAQLLNLVKKPEVQPTPPAAPEVQRYTLSEEQERAVQVLIESLSTGEAGKTREAVTFLVKEWKDKPEAEKTAMLAEINRRLAPTGYELQPDATEVLKLVKKTDVVREGEPKTFLEKINIFFNKLLEFLKMPQVQEILNKIFSASETSLRLATEAGVARGREEARAQVDTLTSELATSKQQLQDLTKRLEAATAPGTTPDPQAIEQLKTQVTQLGRTIEEKQRALDQAQQRVEEEQKRREELEQRIAVLQQDANNRELGIGIVLSPDGKSLVINARTEQGIVAIDQIGQNLQGKEKVVFTSEGEGSTRTITIPLEQFRRVSQAVTEVAQQTESAETKRLPITMETLPSTDKHSTALRVDLPADSIVRVRFERVDGRVGIDDSQDFTMDQEFTSHSIRHGLNILDSDKFGTLTRTVDASGAHYEVKVGGHFGGNVTISTQGYPSATYRIERRDR